VTEPPKAQPAQAKAPEDYGPQEGVSERDSKALIEKYEEALQLEVRALKHRQSLEFKEFKRVQDRKLKAWEMDEDNKKLQAFEQNHDVTFRRRMENEIQTRRAELLRKFDKESAEKLADFQDFERGLLKKQDAKRKEFRAFLSRGERPPKTLWPRN
jgi:hypothetical protein